MFSSMKEFVPMKKETEWLERFQFSCEWDEEEENH